MACTTWLAVVPECDVGANPAAARPCTPTFSVALGSIGPSSPSGIGSPDALVHGQEASRATGVSFECDSLEGLLVGDILDRVGCCESWTPVQVRAL